MNSEDTAIKFAGLGLRILQNCRAWITTSFPGMSSGQYVKFLATNSGFEKVRKLEAQVDVLKEKLSKTTGDSKKAIVKADTAAGKNAELVRDLLALTRCLKNLEDRRS